MSFLKYVTRPDGSACEAGMEPLVVKFNGEAYAFPALKWVEIDDGDVASWFAGKTSTGPDTKAGNPRGVRCLEVAGSLPKGTSAERTYLFGPPPPPPPNPNRLESPHGRPRAKGEPGIGPSKQGAETAEKRAIGDMNPDKLRLACVRTGIPFKGAEKATVVDTLWAKGFRAPRE